MKAWFAGLQQRERIILLGGAAAAAVILIFALVLRPLDQATAALQETVASEQQLLLDLTRLEASDATSPTRAPGETQTLMVLITNTAAAEGLTFPRTRQDGADAMNVTFQNASFDSLLKWLVTLETSHGVVVDTASFSSSREPGLVSGQIFLRRN